MVKMEMVLEEESYPEEGYGRVSIWSEKKKVKLACRLRNASL